MASDTLPMVKDAQDSGDTVYLAPCRRSYKYVEDASAQRASNPLKHRMARGYNSMRRWALSIPCFTPRKSQRTGTLQS
jgi:hypothetical protein